MNVKRFAWESTPLINIMQRGDSALPVSWHMDLLDGTMAMHRALRPPVDALKAKLGKQAFTWVGEYRFWVWEGADWRVFASNIHGVSFEVREGLGREAALEAWNDFLSRVGLNCPFPTGTPVLVFADNVPGTSNGYDGRHSPNISVNLNTGETVSVSIDNIVKDQR